MARARAGWVLGAGLAAAVAVLVASLLAGTALPPARAWAVLAGGGDEVERAIVLDVRLARALAAFVVGAALGMSGAAYQGLFRNPLADPFIVGTSGGAALGGVAAIVLGASGSLLGISAASVAAFGGALAATAVSFGAARVRGRVPLGSLLLVGFAVGALAGAGVAVLLYYHTRNWNEILGWMMGHLAGASWAKVRVAAVATVLAYVALAVPARSLNAWAFGEESAAQLGVEVERVKAGVLAAGALAVAGAVVACGIVGFVGLIVPNVVRALVGPDHRRVIPLSAIVGGAFLGAADLVARLAFPPAGLPAGAVTALVGPLFFVWILRRRVARS